MEIAIRLGGPIAIYFGMDDWLHGEETDEHHVLVSVERHRADTLWKIRRKPKALAQFIVEHGEQLITSTVGERIRPSDAERDELRGFLSRAVPSLSSVVSQLPSDVPPIPWRLVQSFVKGWDRHVELVKSSDRVELMEAYLEAKLTDLGQLILVLAMPSLLGYGAVFDSRKGLVQEAAGVCVQRPSQNVGLGPDVMYFEQRARSWFARPSARRLVGMEDIVIVTRPEWDEVLKRLGSSPGLDDHDRGIVAEARKRFDASEGELFFHAVTKWDDYVIAPASDISHSNREGVFVRAGRNPIYAAP